jgi:hypothetical protein
MNWDTLQPYDKNILIATRIMGWTIGPNRPYYNSSEPPTWDGKQYQWKAGQAPIFIGPDLIQRNEIEPYAQSLQSALKVAEFIFEKTGHTYRLEKLKDGRYKFTFLGANIEIISDDAIEAICKAALLVKF